MAGILASVLVLFMIVVVVFWCLFLSIGVRYFNDRLSIFIRMAQDAQRTRIKLWESQISLIDKNIDNIKRIATLADHGFRYMELDSRRREADEKLVTDALAAWGEELELPEKVCTCDVCCEEQEEEEPDPTDLPERHEFV
jgi:hypothetical protein